MNKKFKNNDFYGIIMPSQKDNVLNSKKPCIIFDDLESVD